MESSETVKYYTPDISEFHVGFEYEEWDSKEQCFEHKVCTKPHHINNAWVKLKAVGMRGVGWEIRVKHLGIEDILSFGFTLVDDIDDTGYTSFEYKDYWLGMKETEAYIEDETGMLFYGNIKNKSELSRILKQTGVRDE